MSGYIEIFRPRNLNEYIGNEYQVRSVLRWFDAMDKPLLLVGPPGTGKTTLAYLAAKKKGYKVIGLNASDEKLKDDIERITKTFKVRKLFDNVIYIFDEVDGFRGHAKLLDNNAILIANDKRKVKDIIGSCEVVSFDYPDDNDKRKYMKYILDKINITLSDESIDDIIRVSHTYRDIAKNVQIHIYGGIPERDIEDANDMRLVALAVLRGKIPPPESRFREFWIWLQIYRPELVRLGYAPDWYKKKVSEFISRYGGERYGEV